VRTGLALVELPGRFQVVPGQPALVLDVAHNPQAVAHAGGQPRRDGLLPAHAMRCSARWRQGHRRPWWRRMVPLVDVWHCCDLPTRAGGHGDELAARHAAVAAGTGTKPVAVHTLIDSPCGPPACAAAAARPTRR
jgi:dihydrofolate synthase/folylpolyglutamate synthase